jgi:hypothetical protein
MQHSTSGPPLPQILQIHVALMPDVLQLLIDRIETPIGELLLVAGEAGKLRVLDWAAVYWGKWL